MNDKQGKTSGARPSCRYNDGRTGATTTAFDPRDILAKALVEVVPLSQVDLNDRHLDVRNSETRACHPDQLVVEDGIVDLKSSHPLILQHTGSGYCSVNGLRRLRAASLREDITHVRCLVLADVPEHDVAIVAARSNLVHGKTLSRAEKKRAFLSDRAARAAGGYAELTDRGWARCYRVSPTTIGSWRRRADTDKDETRHSSQGAVRVEVGADGVQTERSQHTPSVERMLADLRAAASLFLDDVRMIRLSDDHRAELAAIIRELQQLLERPDGDQEDGA